MKNKKEERMNDLTATKIESTTAQNSNSFEMSDDLLSDVAGGEVGYKSKYIFGKRYVVYDNNTGKKLREFKSKKDALEYDHKVNPRR